MQERFFFSNASSTSRSQPYLERTRIYQLLEKAATKPLVTVVAGAGYGKTQAVYSFLARHKAVITWLQLSERDNLGSRFWESFVRAIASRSPKMAAQMAETGFPETDAQFNRYLSIPHHEISSALKYILVFDDFHLIHDPSVLRFIERSINESFPNVTTILISRREPAINLIRLLAKGLVANITEEDLRFSENEIRQYLRLQGIELSTETLSQVYSDAGGWAFAIHLLGLSLSKAPNRERYAFSAMKLNVFKLMESEIFAGASPALREFLIRLSLIDDLSRDLVKKLAPDESLVGEMIGISSFIRYDAYLHAYRIHHLFLDYLRQKQELLSEDEKQATYLAAARWYDENGHKIDAIAYYDKAGDYQAVVNIAYFLPQVPSRSAAEFILGMFDNIFQRLGQENPLIYGLHTRLLISAGRLEEAMAVLRSTAAAFEALPPSKFNCRVLCSIYNNLGFAYMILCPVTGDYDFGRYFERADAYFSQGGPFADYAVRGPVTNANLGPYIFRVGGGEKADPAKYLAALDLLTPHAANSMSGCMYGLSELARAELAYFQNDSRAAEEFAYQALYKAKEKKQYEIQSRALFYLLRINTCAGNYRKIQAVLKQLEAQLEIKEYLTRYVSYDVAMCWYYTAIGQTEPIADWLKKDLGDDIVSPPRLSIETLAQARYHRAAKKHRELMAFLASQPLDGAILPARIALTILEAVCQRQAGEKDKAEAALRAAYELAAPHGWDMLFLELGKDMRSLTAGALKEPGIGIPRPWLEHINSRAATYAKRLAFISAEYKKANHLESGVRLSPREMEILLDLYHGLSRSEIAENRNLSVNTVKSVLQMIYIKLGAENNVDAVRIGSDLGLLSG
ncbi:MAG: LuxR C-terminal-related transcriptional regulator [Peptococcaceae bacterium]|jgi:LuxR family maltose regulon positive regulatory protein|nr:LuxR C-terminal-related transcriptional regulator [Peptococcaceae bacterium]